MTEVSTFFNQSSPSEIRTFTRWVDVLFYVHTADVRWPRSPSSSCSLSSIDVARWQRGLRSDRLTKGNGRAEWGISSLKSSADCQELLSKNENASNLYKAYQLIRQANKSRTAFVCWFIRYPQSTWSRPNSEGKHIYADQSQLCDNVPRTKSSRRFQDISQFSLDSRYNQHLKAWPRGHCTRRTR
jgi:hypothetical protein